MGRKKSHKVVEKSNDKFRLPDEIVEILVVLLDLCGLYPPLQEQDSTSSRLRLISLLVTLDKTLTRKGLVDIDASATATDEEEVGKWLLNLEATITSIRQESDACLQSINDDRVEVILLLQELEVASRAHTDLLPISYFIQSLAAAYRMHLQVEEEMIGHLRRLFDSFYSEGLGSKDSSHGMERSLKQIRRTLELLSRKELSQQPVFQEGLAVASRRQRADRPLNVIESLNTTFKPEQRPTQISPQPCRQTSHITQAATINDALHRFLTAGAEELEAAPVSFLLLVGNEGCGKTHVCDEIERQAEKESLCIVLRPRLPIDILGSSVGDTEDTLISLFSAAIDHPGRVVVILDDLEHIFEETQSLLTAAPGVGGNPGSHLKARSQSTLLSMFDSINRSCSQQDNSRVLVVCTARQDVGGMSGRFDRTYYLESPNENERRLAILSHLGMDMVQETDSDNFDLLLSSLVESTVGRSHAEIAQYCRQAIGNRASAEEKDALLDDAFEILHAMKGQLQSMAPESLRNGITDDFVDMRVMTARDLGASTEIAQDLSAYTPPLFGDSVELAWKELQASIVIPLCRSRELNDLLDPMDRSSRKVVTGGLLLTGGPGSGKTQIAYHCARYAASLLPSLKLLDVSCTSLIHKEVGGSESAVHHLFECARKAAPCILLMDGIENIAAVRGNDPTVEGTLDRILSTLLVELDGVDDHPASDQAGGIAVIGITHNVNWIDAALQRPGRLEKFVELGYPDDGARFQIVSSNLSVAASDEGSPVPTKVVQEISRETKGMAAASIVAVCNDVRMALASGVDLAPGTIEAIVQRRRSNPA